MLATEPAAAAAVVGAATWALTWLVGRNPSPNQRSPGRSATLRSAATEAVSPARLLISGWPGNWGRRRSACPAGGWWSSRSGQPVRRRRSTRRSRSHPDACVLFGERDGETRRAPADHVPEAVSVVHVVLATLVRATSAPSTRTDAAGAPLHWSPRITRLSPVLGPDVVTVVVAVPFDQIRRPAPPDAVSVAERLAVGGGQREALTLGGRGGAGGGAGGGGGRGLRRQRAEGCCPEQLEDRRGHNVASGRRATHHVRRDLRTVESRTSSRSFPGHDIRPRSAQSTSFKAYDGHHVPASGAPAWQEPSYSRRSTHINASSPSTPVSVVGAVPMCARAGLHQCGAPPSRVAPSRAEVQNVSAVFIMKCVPFRRVERTWRRRRWSRRLEVRDVEREAVGVVHPAGAQGPGERVGVLDPAWRRRRRCRRRRLAGA